MDLDDWRLKKDIHFLVTVNFQESWEDISKIKFRYWISKNILVEEVEEKNAGSKYRDNFVTHVDDTIVCVITRKRVGTVKIRCETFTNDRAWGLP